ncbi:WbqC family protein [Virgibacillus dokdonensis]|uniref:WbqC-like protein family protein n=1 Tax=Virgibacillus dokdonensis TaxID=302167 RepID=A0A2K9J4A0_9BACI|nr:WbqC family protein [Virgibacillus dokdonensis]AUJ24841.1 WbqC-like protein family protein [Virgibacillus dokdonensis]
MKVSGHQPCYIPWYGFFEKVAKVDIFAIHDIAQYEKGGYINRNLIKSSQGFLWLTIPIQIKGNKNTPIKEIKIDNTQDWKRRHWKAITVNYNKSKYFRDYRDFFGDIYHSNWEYIYELNMSIISFIMDELNINTKLCYISEMECRHKKKSDFVLSLCKELQADNYLSGKLGKEYLNEKDFELEGINIDYQEIRKIEYQQLFNDFIPNLSIIDILFNCGPVRTEAIVRGERSFDERISFLSSSRR